jgi:transcriptional regulator with XRE-family HTH domain
VIADVVGFQASTYWGAFTAAENGTVVYNSSAGSTLSALTWFDRAGKELARVGEVGVLANPCRQKHDLREFLQARRAALKPRDFGLQDGGRRRAPGLRREEVASLAGVGLTWYTWLEQGRDIRVSEDMLERVARGLRLSPHDTAYLFSLAGRHPPEAHSPVAQIDPAISLALGGFRTGPAFVQNARTDVVAFNSLADAIYRFDAYEGPFARNMVWRLFMDRRRRELYMDWQDFAVFGVGLVRGYYATRIGDADFEGLLHALRAGSPEFDQLWRDSGRRGTSSLSPAKVRFRVPRRGVLKFFSVRFTIPGHPDHLAVLLPAADKKTSQVMAEMARAH